MKNVFYLLIGGGIIGYLIYVVVQVFLIAFGANQSTWGTFSGHLIAGSILLLVVVFGYLLGNKKENNSENQRSSVSQNITAPSYNKDEDEFPVSKLIVTAGKDTCRELESKIRNHEAVVSTFQDSGNWYSNGETGPEWFTLHITTSQDRKEDIDTLVKLELKKIDKFISSQSLFWE
ncbi:hypothetical protein [Winogradskyella sp. A2]|uniref:hypothetical protein n=1 Tax=Winogradskyella sp. A2 TaxID=3366944 RepID=UPI00398C616C